MLEIVSEYVYCLIYVLTLSFVTIYLSKEKVELKRMVLMALMYAVINYFSTKTSNDNLLVFIIMNSLNMFIDYIYLMFLYGYVKKDNLFYSTTIWVLYSFSANSIIHVVDILAGFNRQITLELTLERFIMVVIINLLTVFFAVVIKKLKVVPNKVILNSQIYLFSILNILVCYALLIIFSIGIVELVKLILLLVLILLFLWAMFLKILSMYIETTIKNEELIMEEISNKYINKYLDFYSHESDSLRKLKHDLKNHKIVLESLDKMNQYNQYIDEVFEGVNYNRHIESGNIFIDACLYAKQQEYPEIIFDYDISVNDLIFNEKDLTSLLFNLIDNACNEAMRHDKHVSLLIKYINNILVIRIINKCLVKPSFVSIRGKEHGYGLRIIKSIINKHNGNLLIDYQDEQVIFNIKFNI